METNDPLEGKHGKPSTYNNHKCRCPECKKAWAEYMRPRVKAHRHAKKQAEESAKQAIQINF